MKQTIYMHKTFLLSLHGNGRRRVASVFVVFLEPSSPGAHESW